MFEKMKEGEERERKVKYLNKRENWRRRSGEWNEKKKRKPEEGRKEETIRKKNLY